MIVELKAYSHNRVNLSWNLYKKWSLCSRKKNVNVFVFILSCLKEDNKLFHPLKLVTIITYDRYVKDVRKWGKTFIYFVFIINMNMYVNELRIRIEQREKIKCNDNTHAE